MRDRPRIRWRVGGASLRAAILGTRRFELPESLSLVCRAGPETWLVDRLPGGNEQARLGVLAGHLDRLRKGAGDSRAWWTLVCTADGWREAASGPSEWPAESGLPWDEPDSVLCFGRRRGDRSAVLVAEPHFFMYGRYRKLKAKVRLLGPPFSWRSPMAIYAGGDHGRPLTSEGGTITPRRLLASVVATQGLPVRVVLGSAVSIAEQLRHRMILDVDGYVRTWEAWAWKMLSGSVVLAQSSDWETRFTSEFRPHEHYVPVRADFIDLNEALSWCREHWPEALALARSARRKARSVYRTSWIEQPGEWRRISVALRSLPRPLSDMRLE